MAWGCDASACKASTSTPCRLRRRIGQYRLDLGAQLALHQHRVEPAAELEADVPQGADHAKPETLMQRDGGRIVAVADHGDHLAPLARLAARNQLCQQGASDAHA